MRKRKIFKTMDGREADWSSLCAMLVEDNVEFDRRGHVVPPSPPRSTDWGMVWTVVAFYAVMVAIMVLVFWRLGWRP